jgi:hypothetical protein
LRQLLAVLGAKFTRLIAECDSWFLLLLEGHVESYL